MPSNHLILCHPLLLQPLIFPSIRVFSNESALGMRFPKYWSFSFNMSPSSEHPGLISFREDWLGLLAVPGPLRTPPAAPWKRLSCQLGIPPSALPAGVGAETLHAHCRKQGTGLIPGLGTNTPHAVVCSQKKKRKTPALQESWPPATQSVAVSGARPLKRWLSQDEIPRVEP